MKGQCDSCGFKTKVKRYENGLPGLGAREGKMCEVCANTSAGNAFLYPANHLENTDVLRTVAYVGNMILEAIKEKQ